jgi:hypothetical protein
MKVRIDGYDPYSGICIKHINIWDDPRNRQFNIVNNKVKSNINGQVKHKKKVKLLERKGEDCLIKYKGVIGYIKYWWVLEFKGELLDALENTIRMENGK